jgi:hypothetical protein
MVQTQEKLEIGVWVKVINHDYLEGYVGYITDFDPVDGYRVRITKDCKGKSFKKRDKWMDEEQIIPLPIKKEEDDLLALIDLALETNDKEWFLELTSKLPKEMPW